MYQILKTYTDDPVQGLDLDGHLIDIPTKQVVDETYCGGKYWKRAKGLFFGIEDSGKTWWALGSPTMGRFEYDVQHIDMTVYQVNLTKDISFEIDMYPGDEYPVKYQDKYLSCIQDAIMLFYLNNVFTRTKEDMTYVCGCRKFSNILVELT